MSVKEMGCDFQAYNLCKAIAPQKRILNSLKSVLKVNTLNWFIFTMVWCLLDEFIKPFFLKYVGVP